MHIRLKQRILYYLFVFVIILFLIKLMLFDRNSCLPTTQSSHQNGKASDLWNLNDHNVEIEVKKFIETLQMSSRSLPSSQPLNEITEKVDFLNLIPKMRKQWGHHQLGVVIPYQNRFEEMKELVPYIDKYLNKKEINHKIYIINQVDQHRFNRASLINVGFLIARNESCDYIAMHDVDLLPVNEDLNYGYPDSGPFHISAPHLHPKYHYPTFVGGILLVSVEQFENLNGLSNKFWGWGREDDEFYMRIVDKGYEVHKHGDEIKTGYETFKHIHGPSRKRDYVKLPGQKEAMFSRDRETGVNDIRYEIKGRQNLFIDGSHCSVIDVSLYCNTDLTPWCNMPKTKRRH